MRIVYAVAVIGLSALLGHATLHAASGRSQDEAIAGALNEICPPTFDGFFAPDLGPNLARYCSFRRSLGIIIPGSPGGDGGSATSHQSETDRLAANRRNRQQAQADQVLAEDWRVYLSVSQRREEKTQTRLEPGFDLDSDALLVGLERRFGSVHVGVAVAREDSDGDFRNSGGGRLRVDSDHYWLYLNGNLGQNYWYGFSLGRSDSDYDTLRRLRFDDTEALFADLGADALVPSRSDSHQTQARADIGREWPLQGGYSVVVDGALSYQHRRYDRFAERGEVALRLAFAERSERSLRSSVGAELRRAISSASGVWLPSAGLRWQHEFADDAQDIVAFFAEDGRANPTAVVFSTDPPDRNSAIASLGLSWIGAHGWSADLRYRREIGYSNYDRDNLSVMVGMAF